MAIGNRATCSHSGRARPSDARRPRDGRCWAVQCRRPFVSPPKPASAFCAAAGAWRGVSSQPDILPAGVQTSCDTSALLEPCSLRRLVPGTCRSQRLGEAGCRQTAAGQTWQTCRVDASCLCSGAVTGLHLLKKFFFCLFSPYLKGW